jgi:hypothetical protein
VADAIMLPGKLRTGGVESITVTVNVPVLTFPVPSVAVTVTVVVPIGNVLPLAGEYVIVGVPKLSVAVAAAYVTVAPLALVA